MATTVKASKPTRLSEREDLSTFTDWRNNLEFFLHSDKDFSGLLKPGSAWQKSSTDVEHRGLASAVERQQLERMLGIIASLAPPFLHGDIVEDSVSLIDIYKKIRAYYSFASNESTFIKFHEIRREIIDGQPERPQHLYCRIRQFVRDNLLKSDGSLMHDGVKPTSDEKMSPTVDRLIVLRWMELLHPRLPALVARVFSGELQQRTLKDLQPSIVNQLEELLAEISRQEEHGLQMTEVRRLTEEAKAEIGRVSDYGSGRRFSRGGRRIFGGRNRSSCFFCRGMMRDPWAHDISACPFVPPSDRARFNWVSNVCSEQEDAPMDTPAVEGWTDEQDVAAPL